MTLQEISTTFKVDPDKLYAELKLAQDKVPLTTKAKDVRTLLGVSEAEFDTQKIRDTVKKLTGFTGAAVGTEGAKSASSQEKH